MKQFKSLDETSIIEKMVNTMLSISDQFYCFHPLKIVMFIIYQSQLIFYLYYPTYEGFQSLAQNQTSDQILLYFLRPDIIVLKYGSQIFLDIIPYIVLAFLIIIKIGIVLNLKNHDERFAGKWKRLGQFQQWIIFLISYYQQLLGIALRQPIQTLIACSLNKSLYDAQYQNTGYFALLIFGVIIFFIVELEALIQLFVIKQSTTLNILAFEKIMITYIDIVIYLLQLGQIIIFASLPHIELSKTIQTTFVMVINLLFIYGQIYYQGYILNYQRYILFFIHSAILSYSIYSLIGQTNQSIIIWPLLCSIIFIIDNEIQKNAIFSIFKQNQKNMNNYILQLIKICNGLQSKQELQNIYYSLIWESHKVKCKQDQCLCKDIVLNVIDSKQATIVTEEMFKLFIFKKIKQITKKLHSLTNFSEYDFTYYEIVQATLFMRQGFLLMAVKSFNKLLNLQPKEYRIRQQSSEKTIQQQTSERRKKKESQIDSQIKILIMNQQKKLFRYQLLTTKLNVSSLTYYKIKFLLSKAQRQLNENFGNAIYSQQQLNMSDHIYNYLINEFDLSSFFQEATNIIKIKIELFYYISKCEIINADIIFNYFVKCFTQILNLEQKILIKYESFSSIKLKQLIIYFYSRIYNSYLKALKFRTVNNNLSHKYIYQNQVVDFYSNKIAYVLLQLQDDLQNLKIKQYSNNFLKLVQKQFRNDQILSFNQLLPDFIEEQHPILVQNFIATGKARFYRSLSTTFIQLNNGLAKQMDQSFDTISLLDDNKIVFGAILQDVDDQKGYFLVNVNGELSGMTYNSLRKLGFSQDDISNINDFYSFYGVEITQIVPSFNELIDRDFMEQKFDNIKIHFIDITFLTRDAFSRSSLMNSSFHFGRLWQDNKYLKEYSASLFIMKREIYNFFYFIIEIESAILVDLSRGYTTTGENVHTQTISQYKNTPMMGESAIFDVESLILSIDENAAKQVYTLNVREREDYQQQTNQLKHQVEMEKTFQVILSPNNSLSQLIDKSQNQIINTANRQNSSFQQDFFCQQPPHNYLEISSKEMNSNQKHIFNFNYDQPQIINSDSSLETSKRPQFYKKFQIIDQFYSTFNFQQQQLLIFFIVLTFIIFSIFAILILSVLNSDLSTNIQEIEMLSLQADIVAPYDRYLAIRAQIYYYNTLYPLKINKTFNSDLVEPLYTMVPICYQELKLNTYNSLTEKDLKGFFKNIYTNTFFMGITDKIIYSRNITFREFLHQLLSYQYDFKIIFDKRIPTKGCPCQVFQFSNYFNLQDNLETISQEILTYTQEKCSNIIDKWIIIWVCWMLVGFLFCGLLFYVKKLILFQYDTIIEIITFISEQSIQNEIDKLKLLLTQLQSSNDDVNSYQLKLQSEISIKEKGKQDKQENDIKKSRRKQLGKTSSIKSGIFAGIIFSLFLLYSSIVTLSTKSFLNQYQDTSSFYKLIADLSFRSGNMFLYREIYMLWNNLTYLNKTDGLRLYNLIDLAQQAIQEYIDIAPRINLGSLLVPNNFYSYFFSVQNEDVCEFLDSQFGPMLTPYCTKAFEGALLKGMIAGLTYISQTIKTQQAINNFTYRAEDIYYEVEGGQVASRVFTYMNDQLQQGIISKTETFNYQNQLLSIFFLFALFSLAFYILFFYYAQIKRHLQLLKFCILMIPQNDIIKNDFFERFLKQIELKLGYKV